MRACVHAFMCACVRASVRACMCIHVCVCLSVCGMGFSQFTVLTSSHLLRGSLFFNHKHTCTKPLINTCTHIHPHTCCPTKEYSTLMTSLLALLRRHWTTSRFNVYVVFSVTWHVLVFTHLWGERPITHYAVFVDSVDNNTQNSSAGTTTDKRQKGEHLGGL